jgi:hypothetical protein
LKLLYVFKLGKLGVKGKTAPEIWDAVLAS